MALTTAQLTTLKADIAADQALSSLPNNSDGNFAIAAVYNIVASPDFWVWRTSVSKAELTNTSGPEGTTFTWVGNGFITRSAGEQAAWREIFNGSNNVNPSLANVRQAFSDIFSGAGNAAANRTHLLAVARKKATRAQKLFASGTGSTASPAMMQGDVTEFYLMSYQEVEMARNLP